MQPQAEHGALRVGGHHARVADPDDEPVGIVIRQPRGSQHHAVAERRQVGRRQRPNVAAQHDDVLDIRRPRPDVRPQHDVVVASNAAVVVCRRVNLFVLLDESKAGADVRAHHRVARTENRGRGARADHHVLVAVARDVQSVHPDGHTPRSVYASARPRADGHVVVAEKVRHEVDVCASARIGSDRCVVGPGHRPGRSVPNGHAVDGRAGERVRVIQRVVVHVWHGAQRPGGQRALRRLLHALHADGHAPPRERAERPVAHGDVVKAAAAPRRLLAEHAVTVALEVPRSSPLANHSVVGPDGTPEPLCADQGVVAAPGPASDSEADARVGVAAGSEKRLAANNRVERAAAQVIAPSHVAEATGANDDVICVCQENAISGYRHDEAAIIGFLEHLGAVPGDCAPATDKHHISQIRRRLRHHVAANDDAVCHRGGRGVGPHHDVVVAVDVVSGRCPYARIVVPHHPIAGQEAHGHVVAPHIAGERPHVSILRVAGNRRTHV